MAEFFKNIDLEDAMQIEAAARFIFDLRQASTSILSKYDVADIGSLHQAILKGDIPEHPGYEDYLSHKVLSQMIEVAREELRRFQRRDLAETPITNEAGIHLALKAKVDEAFPSDCIENTNILKDALVVKFASGVILECRIFSSQEYSFRWVWGDGEIGIDTGPNKLAGAGGGSHFHRMDGEVVSDKVTRIGDAPVENLFRLIRGIAEDPFLREA